MVSPIKFLEALLISAILTSSHAQSNNESELRIPRSESQLIAHLLSDYHPYGRPLRDASQIMNVTVQSHIYSLISVNEQQEQIKLLVWQPQSWMDEFLRWEPADWTGIQRVNIPANLIWLPDGYIFNTVDMKEPLTQLNARVRSDGFVEVDFNKLVDLRCPMDVLAFPFDEQLCTLQFGSWSYQIDQLHHEPKESTIPDIPQNCEWDIASFAFEKFHTTYKGANGAVNQYEEVFFRLRIRRKPLYYIVVLLIPTFVIVNVAILGIFTPQGVQGDREEKISLGLTTLLTMSIILGMVTGEMPKSAAGLPILGRYILMEMAISVVAITASAITIFCHERVLYLNSPPPRYFTKILGKERYNIFGSGRPLLMSPCLEDLRSGIDELRQYLERKTKTHRARIYWQRFFSIVDIVNMVVLLIANCICTYGIFAFALPATYGGTGSVPVSPH